MAGTDTLVASDVATAKLKATTRKQIATSKLPLVSVVVPNRNRARLLAEAIDSILSQDYPNLECIVVDGASTDGSIDVLKTYGDRIRWVSEPDRGAFDAINKGWAMSHGDILAWLNSDDLWTRGAVSTAVRHLMDEPNVDVVYGECGGIDEHGRLVEVFKARPWDFNEAVFYCDHLINQAASFMRRDILEKVDYLYPAWCHDHDLWLRIALAGGTFKAVPDRLADARIWSDNLGVNPNIVVPAKIGITERFFATPGLPQEMRRMKRRTFSNTYVKAASYLNIRRPADYRLGAKLIAKALLTDPLNYRYVMRVVSGGVLRALGGSWPARLASKGRRLKQMMRSRRLSDAPVLALTGVNLALFVRNPSFQRFTNLCILLYLLASRRKYGRPA